MHLADLSGEVYKTRRSSTRQNVLIGTAATGVLLLTAYLVIAILTH